MLNRKTATKEHVVGRCFVPKGALHQSWNLILRACIPCNLRKSDLEDDISAISLLLSSNMLDEEGTQADAKRKVVKSISRRTNKQVAQSTETMKFQASPFPGLQISATMIAPPQIDQVRAFELASMQVTAFFYLLTYDATTKLGSYYPGGFFPLSMSALPDWGNPVQRWFMKMVAAWPIRLIAPIAHGYYTVSIRRYPTADVWSWAIEWNKSIRVIGLFGEEDPIKMIVDGMPEMKWQIQEHGEHGFRRIRLEILLEDNDDVLFA